MDTKLTLNVDDEIIKKAKEYARSNKISLSRLIESYLASLTSRKKSEIKITPLVESLSGVIQIPDDFDFNVFEDAVQFFTALENKQDILITRNLKDFKNAKIPVMTAEEFLVFVQN